MTARSCIWSSLKMTPLLFPRWRLFARFRVESESAVSSSRRQPRRPLSATIECWATDHHESSKRQSHESLETCRCEHLRGCHEAVYRTDASLPLARDRHD